MMTSKCLNDYLPVEDYRIEQAEWSRSTMKLRQAAAGLNSYSDCDLVDLRM